MLFDLRGRGRRRTVQTIYLGLALLMGGGLIFFGIGGGTNSGGLLNAVGKNGGGKANGVNVYSDNIKTAQRRVVTTPADPAAWAALAHAQFQIAGIGDSFDQANGVFTAKGKAQLAAVKQSWDKYMSLKPKQPDVDVASEMVQAFGPSGLNQLDEAVGAQEIVVGGNATSAAQYARLALLAYLAGQTRKADLSAQKAISLAPADQRPTLRQQLSDAKKQASSQALKQSRPGGSTTLPSG
jgi:hypothetical protein